MTKEGVIVYTRFVDYQWVTEIVIYSDVYVVFYNSLIIRPVWELFILRGFDDVIS